MIGKFDVDLVDNKRKKHRQLIADENGLKLMNDKTEEWSKPSCAIFSISQDSSDGKSFTITTISQYEFIGDPSAVPKIKDSLTNKHKTSSLNVALKSLGVEKNDLVRPLEGMLSLSPYDGRSPRSPLQELKLPKSLGHPIIDITEKHLSLSLNDFELLHVIGKGSFGEVFQVRKKSDGKIYAMKSLRKDELFAKNQIEHTLTERKILGSLHHPYVPQLHYAFQSDTRVFMVMDFANGGEIFFHLKKANRFPEILSVFYTAEVISVIDKLHKHSIIYRDLKPENVLVDYEGHVKVIDFGLCKTGVTSIGGDKGKGVSTHTFCGTPEYLAPEILQGIPHGKAVDWWSVGILFYEMVTGLPPFYSENRSNMFHNIVNSEIQIPNVVSAEASDFIRRILKKRPEERLGSGAGEGKEVKRHPLFRKIDWDKIEHRRITPPFKPKLMNGIMNVNNIDKQYLSMIPMETPDPPLDPVVARKINRFFVGFEFNKDEKVTSPICSPLSPISPFSYPCSNDTSPPISTSRSPECLYRVGERERGRDREERKEGGGRGGEAEERKEGGGGEERRGGERRGGEEKRGGGEERKERGGEEERRGGERRGGGEERRGGEERKEEELEREAVNITSSVSRVSKVPPLLLLGSSHSQVSIDSSNKSSEHRPPSFHHKRISSSPIQAKWG